jgi:ADP-heptose:LPS heptosyltransferase
VITLLSLLGYGDALITAALLERAGSSVEHVRTVGTSITAKVGELLEQPRAPDQVLFDEVPAFYALKKHGPVQALKDALTLRRWSQSHVAPSDTLIFEKPPSVRNRWMVSGRGATIIEIPKHTTVYQDRAEVLAPLIGNHRFPPVALPTGKAKTLLINPSSRIAEKALTVGAVRGLVEAARVRDIAVTLVDVDGTFAAVAGEVDHYLLKPALADAARALKASDRYIGPDSFFLHLAYYYRVPELVFFPEGSNYFRPPGLFEQGCGLYLKDLENPATLNPRLDWFLG